MTDEIWKDIVAFEGCYQVSNLGRVRSLDRVVEQRNRWGGLSVKAYRGKILAGMRDRNGYVSVMLGAHGGRHSIHRLVAVAFIENPDELPEVNHKNGNKSDNAASNLEWVSSSDNKYHSYKELVRKQHEWTTPVVLSKGDVNIEFPSQLAAANHLGVVAGSIRSAMKRDHLCQGWAVTQKDAA